MPRKKKAVSKTKASSQSQSTRVAQRQKVSQRVVVNVNKPAQRRRRGGGGAGGGGNRQPQVHYLPIGGGGGGGMTIYQQPPDLSGIVDLVRSFHNPPPAPPAAVALPVDRIHREQPADRIDMPVLDMSIVPRHHHRQHRLDEPVGLDMPEQRGQHRIFRYVPPEPEKPVYRLPRQPVEHVDKVVQGGGGRRRAEKSTEIGNIDVVNIPTPALNPAEMRQVAEIVSAVRPDRLDGGAADVPVMTPETHSLQNVLIDDLQNAMRSAKKTVRRSRKALEEMNSPQEERPTAIPVRRGRKPKYATEQERKEAIRESQAKYRAKIKSLKNQAAIAKDVPVLKEPSPKRYESPSPIRFYQNPNRPKTPGRANSVIVRRAETPRFADMSSIDTPRVGEKATLFPGTGKSLR